MRDKVSSCCQIKWKSSKRDVFYMKKTLEDTWFNYLRLLRCHLSHCSQQQRVSLWKIWRSNDYSNRYFHIQIGMWVLYQDKIKKTLSYLRLDTKAFLWTVYSRHQCREHESITAEVDEEKWTIQPSFHPCTVRLGHQKSDAGREKSTKC